MAKVKPKMSHITEPDENLVHYASNPLSGNVTLCGLDGTREGGGSRRILQSV